MPVSPRGVLRDEARTYRGTSAIKRRNEAARKKYHHAVEPIEVVERGGMTVVTARLSGDFRNSPLQVAHIFQVKGDKVESMEIR